MPIFKTNKADLRGKYRLHLEISSVITLVLLIAAFKYIPKANTIKKSNPYKEPPINIVETEPTEQKAQPPEKPKPAEPVVALDDGFEDIPFNETEINLGEKLDAPPPMIKTHKKIEEDQIFIAVEHEPEIIGGLAALQSKVHYTEMAKRIGIEGTIYIQIVVNEEGKVIDAKILRGLSPDLDEMSLNAVKSTLFKPGTQRGRPVKVRMTVPIKFRLN